MVSEQIDNHSKNKKNGPLIMVVDDEIMVLKVTSIIISKMGYRPLSFSQSKKALEYYGEHFKEIDLVLMDMVMPELNGKKLFLAMKKINSQIKAILLSGWVEDDDNLEFHEMGLLDYLHKPVNKKHLEQSINKALL